MRLCLLVPPPPLPIPPLIRARKESSPYATVCLPVPCSRHIFRIRVTGNRWNDHESSLATSFDMVVNIVDANESPWLMAPGWNEVVRRSAPENAAAGTLVGAPIQTFDPDALDDLTHCRAKLKALPCRLTDGACRSSRQSR